LEQQRSAQQYQSSEVKQERLSSASSTISTNRPPSSVAIPSTASAPATTSLGPPSSGASPLPSSDQGQSIYPHTQRANYPQQASPANVAAPVRHLTSAFHPPGESSDHDQPQAHPQFAFRPQPSGQSSYGQQYQHMPGPNPPTSSATAPRTGHYPGYTPATSAQPPPPTSAYPAPTSSGYPPATAAASGGGQGWAARSGATVAGGPSNPYAAATSGNPYGKGPGHGYAHAEPGPGYR